MRRITIAGNPVADIGTSPAYWESTHYQWIKHQHPHANPEGAAAVYWDLPGQPSYLSSLGLQSIEILVGHGTAAVAIIANAYVPTPAGPQLVSVYQENAVLRRGKGPHATYYLPSHTTDPEHTGLPGIATVFGEVTFESFPGDGGGALMAYHFIAVPTGDLVGNAPFRAAIAQQFGVTAAAHVQRMQQGPTAQQLWRLRHALK